VQPLLRRVPRSCATMERFAERTGRATASSTTRPPRGRARVVIMGSGAETAQETVDWLVARGEKVGVVKVRLYRPFDVEDFSRRCPRRCARIAVLDRTKEPGAVGEPLYLDVVAALARPATRAAGLRRCPASSAAATASRRRSSRPRWCGGLRRAREAAPKPLHRRHRRRRHAPLAAHDASFDIEPDDVVRAVFFGLGADGTVGANKNSIKIIGEETDALRPGLLRLRLEEVRRDHRLAPALRPAADPVDVPHRARELRRLPPVRLPRALRRARGAAEGATFLLNAPYAPADEVWDALPREMQQPSSTRSSASRDRRVQGRQGGRHGRPHQHRDADVLLRALRRAAARRGDREYIKGAIEKTYGKKGEEVVEKNFAAVDDARAPARGAGPRAVTADRTRRAAHRVAAARPTSCSEVTADDARGQGRPAPGQRLPRRRHLADRHHEVGEAQHRRRDPGLGSGDLHPVQQVRARLPARGDPRQGLRARGCSRARRSPSSHRLQGRRVRRATRTRSRSPPRTAPAAASASRSARRRTSEPAPQGLDMAPQAPLRERRARELRLLPRAARPDRARRSRST
jgi:pyruvate-ferredoxin/flavodoxin oxidoreductase